MKILGFVCVSAVAMLSVLSACSKPATPPANNNTNNNGNASTNGTTPSGGGYHGAPIELGTADIGTFSVRAARDEGDITPGGEAPIDIWVTGAHDSIIAVRFWIGSEDAAGSIKAKADIENPAQPNHWHTHAMVPQSMPDGAKLWVEIETEAGRQVGSFDLHTDHTH